MLLNKKIFCKIYLTLMLAMLLPSALLAKDIELGSYVSLSTGFNEMSIQEVEPGRWYDHGVGYSDYKAFNSTKGRSSNVSGVLKAGWTVVVDKKLLAIEFGFGSVNNSVKNLIGRGYVRYDGNDLTPNANPIISETKMDFYQTILFKFGGFIKEDNLFSISLGAAVADFEKSILQLGGDDDVNYFDSGQSSKSKTKELGYVIGLNYDRIMNNKISIVSSIEYMRFDKVNFNFSNLIFEDAPVFLEQDTDIELYNITVGISYKF